ncbi:hypothetical protein TGAMA5MH_03413 [Trichoderma gamsii]|uniref:Uncharacterized protein n=1 Tax=Trichoderma gamsii TaxID=398673 RepID=A0A2K0THJ6_9HYPO|nr:hypothetical protein TGAMA5MH_03413 [Trichoderma gamsii]
MQEIDPQAHKTVSIVRMSFQPAHKDKIEASEEWFTATDKLKQEPDIAFVTKGQAIDDELDIALFISWDYAAKPSASFLSGNIHHIFSPLDNFLAKKPRLMCNLYCTHPGQSTHSFTTSRSGYANMREMMMVRGPVNVIEAAMVKISEETSNYLDALGVGTDFYDIYFSEKSLWGIGALYRVRNENGNEESSGEEHADCATFAFSLLWFSPSRRAKFQDPNIPDSAIPPVFQEFYGSNWWQEKVIKPLEEVGATVSSWTYHKGEIARDRKGKGRLVISKFKSWLEFGYMDDVSLAEFERQLAEKEHQSDSYS